MSEEEEKEDEENEGEENEDEEKEGEENEDEEKEGEENEDEEGEEKEDDEGEEGEEEEDDNKKKGKKKKGGKKEEKSDQNKFPENKLSPSKEIKIDLNSNNNNSNIFFNTNDITMGNIFTKKSSLQLLMEISADMDALSSHLDQVLPPLPKYPKITNIPNYTIPISSSPLPNYDNDDLEIKRLINKANEMLNDSILSKKENEKKEVKIYEDKGCQSDDDLENSEKNNYEDETLRYNNGINKGMNRTYGNNNEQMNGNFTSSLYSPNFYRGSNILRRQPIIYKQPESNTFDGNLNNNRFQRYRPTNVNQAMNILLDKK